ncbi:hypothetical protein [Cohnella thermotolerans]|uniref:hypothetical protein n=1 Tax=Cohnella thermotolerans TaxID=329858 RepID=UPI00308421CE
MEKDAGRDDKQRGPEILENRAGRPGTVDFERDHGSKRQQQEADEGVPIDTHNVTSSQFKLIYC